MNTLTLFPVSPRTNTPAIVGLVCCRLTPVSPSTACATTVVMRVAMSSESMMLTGWPARRTSSTRFGDAVTVTSSRRALTCSVISTDGGPWLPTVRGIRDSPSAAFFAMSRYRPALGTWSVNRPCASVCAVATAVCSAVITVTVASATTPPDGSFTIPVTSTAAYAATAVSAHTANAAVTIRSRMELLTHGRLRVHDRHNFSI